MEMIGDFRRNSVVNELTQGKKLASELKRKLQTDFTSRETCNFLLETILTNYDNALSILDCMSSLGNGEIPPQPKSSNQTRKDHVNKRRKMCKKKNDEVRVCSWNGVDSQLNDGYNWRKYGQKDILGATHPRAYYRCTHRLTQGCLATKKVQQTNKDPSTFEVIYKGKHSCIDQASKQNKDETILPSQTNEEQILLPLADSCPPQMENITPFSFQSAYHENSGATIVEEPNQLTAYSTPFLLSPETSESYFSMSASCQVNEMISDTTSFANFQLGDFELNDFGCDFFDASDYFCPSLL